jgi:hypothetical protein
MKMNTTKISTTTGILYTSQNPAAALQADAVAAAVTIRSLFPPQVTAR